MEENRDIEIITEKNSLKLWIIFLFCIVFILGIIIGWISTYSYSSYTVHKVKRFEENIRSLVDYLIELPKIEKKNQNNKIYKKAEAFLNNLLHLIITKKSNNDIFILFSQKTIDWKSECEKAVYKNLFSDLFVYLTEKSKNHQTNDLKLIFPKIIDLFDQLNTRTFDGVL